MSTATSRPLTTPARVPPAAGEPLEEVHTCTTRDGWRLALTRFRPAKETRRHPVLLVPGLSSNRFSYDLTPRASLARYLARHGYDTWILELRGHGRSDRPKLVGKGEAWTFDDHLFLDFPAALDRIRELTSRSSVHVVGHSMGGIMLYGHMALGGEGVRSAVTIGSSLDYSGSSSWFHGLTRFLWLERVVPAVPFGPMMQLTSPLRGHWANVLDEFNAWHANVVPDEYRQLCRSNFHVISPRVLTQLATAFSEGGLRSVDGSWRYLKELEGKPSVPVLALGGSKDRQCPPEAVAHTLESVHGAELRMFGRGQGHAEHYGHFDLVMGKHAPDELWPLLLEWLDHNDG